MNTNNFKGQDISIFKKVIVRIFIVMFGIFLLDVFDVPSVMDIPICNINFDMWSILIVIVLFMLTYELLDKRDNARKKNQEEVARMLLL